MSLRDEIATEIGTPISVDECVRLCGPGNFKGILYDDLRGWTKERLAKYDGIVILFTKHDGADGVGHFVCLFKLRGVWHFYDSLAVGYDKLLHIMHTTPHLTNILKGEKVEHNMTRYQKLADNTQDCALHVATRLRKRGMSHRQYGRWLKYKRLSPDEIVSLLHACDYHF